MIGVLGEDVEGGIPSGGGGGGGGGVSPSHGRDFFKD